MGRLGGGEEVRQVQVLGPKEGVEGLHSGGVACAPGRRRPTPRAAARTRWGRHEGGPRHLRRRLQQKHRRPHKGTRQHAVAVFAWPRRLPD